TVTAPEELATLGQSFNEMAARVEEMISTLRNFVSDAAHELHTPLTALRTDLELATETKSPALIPRALTQADRLKALVDNLLNLSRIEAREHLHTSINLPALLREMSELYASRAEQAGLSFTLTGADVEATIMGNDLQLRSAVSNLLDNALKFTPEGGQIGLTLAAEDEGWAIHVTDTGLGIPPEEIPLLFRRFHRARNVSEYPGNGLGLAIVKAIADAHGGRVWAENLGAGARVSLWVPREGNS
ncbi:MAG TPA: HAMP domain-containing sensor histidine kinase, partial [Anaerolineales bacterium]|nr:HAMP domain-containing sensor histidine kinase [Anaerolineales bacterium]